MSNTIKGLLIDPEKLDIYEVHVPVDEDGSCLAGMYDVLGCRTVDCGRGGLRFLPGAPEDDVWFDDEGKFSDKKHAFMIPGWVPLIGKGLILGFDEEGYSTDHTLTADAVLMLKFSVRMSLLS